MVEKTTWILVGDASRARLFEERASGHGLSLVESFEHAESRSRARDLMADATGRKPVGPAVGTDGGARNELGRPGVEPDTDPKEVEAQKFARELAERLERGRLGHAYDEVVLVAPPHFLGLLRAEVSGEVAKRLSLALDKDYAMLDVRELESRVRAARAG